MPIVRVDREVCEGYAHCVFTADDVFDLDSDEVVVLLQTEIIEEDRARVAVAAQSCPVGALTISDR